MQSNHKNPISISNQIVLVTGGARGLGAAIAQAFLRENARVVINYHQSKQAAEKLQAEGNNNAIAIKADVTNPDEVKKMVEIAENHFNSYITTIVNNALPSFKFDGDNRPKAENLTWSRIDQQVQGSLRGCLNTVQACLKGMKSLEFGRIINIGTNLVQHPVVPYHDYTAAKAALLSFTRTLSKDLGKYGITVNMMSGGLLQETDASSATPAEVFNLIAKNTPLGRVTTPEEFADIALFFASPWSRAITGQNILVDGGLVNN